MGEPNFTNMTSRSPLLLVLGFALCGLAVTATAHFPRHHHVLNDGPLHGHPTLHDLYETQAELRATQLELNRERALTNELRHKSHAQAAPQPSPHQATAATAGNPPEKQPRRHGCAICELVTTLATLGVVGALFKVVSGCGSSRCGGVMARRVLKFVAFLFVAFLSLNTLSWIFFLLLPVLLPVLLILIVPFMANCFSPSFAAFSCPTKIVPVGETLPASPLSTGARGPGVAQLQSCLIKLGHMRASAVRYRSGFYGPLTTDAIAKLQALAKLQPTGQFDAAVREELIRQLSTTSASEASPRNNVENSADTSDISQPVPSTTEQHASSASKKQLLLEMGFPEHDVEGVIDATNGSLQEAATWLIAHSEAKAAAQELPEFPTEWGLLLDDLEQMGFDHELAKAALMETDGQVKAAVKAMVTAERGRQQSD